MQSVSICAVASRPQPLRADRRSPVRSTTGGHSAGWGYAVRNASSSCSGSQDDSKDSWSRHRSQYNYDPFTLHPEAKHYTYPLVTADELASCSVAPSTGPGGRPRQVRMLARDFIHDSLYNPHYGYFAKQAVLLPDPVSAPASEPRERQVAGQMYTQDMGLLRPVKAGFDFNSIKNESEFMRLVEERYAMFEEQISILVQDHQNSVEAQQKQYEFQTELARERADRVAKRSSTKLATAEYSAAGLEAAQRRGRALRQSMQETDVQSMAAKQVWHTPTQIFQPYYAHAIARYLVAEYKLHNYPYDDLVIYELGAGSGALAKGILDYLQEREPEIYTRTRYKIVEISARLAAEQRCKLDKHGVEVVNEDILKWEGKVVQEPCFVVALEVFDNLAHDVVRFSTVEMEAYQAMVSIDDTGDMHELWQPLQDALIRQYLATVGDSLSPLSNSLLRFLPPKLRQAVAKHAPFFPNLSPPVFVPTNALRLLHRLKTHFPKHRLVMSDFDALPNALVGINAPVVQTRYQTTMIAVTTYLVLQGYFDIFFPTNFQHLTKVYKSIMSNSQGTDFFSSHFNPATAQAWSAADRNVKVYPHAAFLQRYAETEKLQLKDGTNPLLSWYANASWFLS